MGTNLSPEQVIPLPVDQTGWVHEMAADGNDVLVLLSRGPGHRGSTRRQYGLVRVHVGDRTSVAGNPVWFIDSGQERGFYYEVSDLMWSGEMPSLAYAIVTRSSRRDEVVSEPNHALYTIALGAGQGDPVVHRLDLNPFLDDLTGTPDACLHQQRLYIYCEEHSRAQTADLFAGRTRGAIADPYRGFLPDDWLAAKAISEVRATSDEADLHTWFERLGPSEDHACTVSLFLGAHGRQANSRMRSGSRHLRRSACAVRDRPDARWRHISVSGIAAPNWGHRAALGIDIRPVLLRGVSGLSARVARVSRYMASAIETKSNESATTPPRGASARWFRWRAIEWSSPDERLHVLDLYDKVSSSATR